MMKKNDLKKVLKNYFGHNIFKENQEKIINTILKKKDIIGILPTGSGKSLCFQLPGIFFKNITIVISPLISLIENQVKIMQKQRIPTIALTSYLTEKQMKDSIKNIKEGKFKFIYLSPERLFSNDFNCLLNIMKIDQLVIDEAHCISEWGHDFRPKYKKIGEIISRLNKKPVISAFTATANEKVLKDILKYLNLKNPKIFRTTFDRPNLFIDIKPYENNLKFIINYILNNHKNELGLIYCSTRTIVEKVAQNLIKNNILAGIYHAGLKKKERRLNQNNFFLEKYNVLVATNAFGMGIDKKNIRYIIHYNMPGSIEAYYQEIGRAGRDGLKSKCILLFSKKDILIHKFLLKKIDYHNKINIKNKKKSIEKMKDFVHTTECYKKFILEYFGEKIKPCGNCGNCLSVLKSIDCTVESKKIFSAIYYLKGNFDYNVLIDVLIGKKNKFIAFNELNKLSVFGILKEKKEQEIKILLKKLLKEKYILLKEKKYILLKEKAVVILKNKRKIFLNLKIKN